MPCSREQLLAYYAAALAAVAGRERTRLALAHSPPFDQTIAIGKAAAAMLAGAGDALGEGTGRRLLITKPGHLAPIDLRGPRTTIIEAGHPIPDAASLAAGELLLQWVAEAAPQARLLFLLSGGTSALVEAPIAGVTLALWQQVNSWLLASGLPITAINRVRSALSRIKGGGLGARLVGRTVRVLLISDVPGDDPAVIGSGPLWTPPTTPLPALPEWIQALLPTAAPAAPPHFPHEIIATNAAARSAAAAAARAAGWAVVDHGAGLHAELPTVVARIAAELDGLAPGLHLWGGEPTVRLPPEPGRGGRAQTLALGLAQHIAGRADVTILVAGTDGSDGPTEDAGALVDGGTIARGRLEGGDPAQALAQADAGTFLAASGDLLATGATGTNVMDLLLVLRR